MSYILTLARRQSQLAFEQSQKEVDDLHQRTREGIETARRNGKQIGPKFGSKLNIKKKIPVQQLILKYIASPVYLRYAPLSVPLREPLPLIRIGKCEQIMRPC